MGDPGPKGGEVSDEVAMDEMDQMVDQLPFGLSDQLGQLILGAAQNFNADNPQFDMNFFAPVFGGDEDFGFNPGDEDMYLLEDSDSDSFADEEESSQIFISLADSHSVRRLSFHKNVEGVHRFPKVKAGEWPCYEELYRLLEEVELLGKVWRRRQEHPFTAHIAPAGGQALREGEDYYSSDYEYDSDEEEDFDQLPPGGVNETLTKKKYCQSFKLFHQIFDSVKQFEAFQRSLSKMKKYIFGIIFALFLEALPPATRFRIPQELWEKVWKFTQNAYFRYKDSVPLHKDTTYYRAGLRGADSRLAGLERERLKELYGSVGNLHMIMFEVLFKNPSILQPNPLFELEAGETAQEKLARGAFRGAMQAARTSFCRLQQLEPVLAEPGDPAAGLAQTAGLDLELKMAAGTYLVSDVGLKLQPLPCSVAKLDPPSSVIVSRSVCSRFVLTGRYLLTEGGEEFGLLLAVVSAVTGEVEQIIHTGHSYQNHLIEVGACGVRRKGGSSWKNHFFLTEDRISFMTRVVEASTDTVRAWSFALSAAARPPSARGGPPLVTAVSRPGRAVPAPRPQAAAAVGHTASALLLLVQSPFAPGPHTCLTLYSLECGEPLLEVPWPGEDLSLLGLTDSRALLAGPASILFFSLSAGEVVQAFPINQLNAEHSLPDSEPWTAVFDCDPARRQMLLYTPTLSAFRLLQWAEQEMAAPALLLRGAPLAEAAEGLGTNVLLSGGSLITNRSRDLPLAGSAGGPAGPWAGPEDGRLASHEVAGWGLAAGARHLLLSMAADRAQAAAADLLLNQLSQRRWDEAWAGRPDRQLWNPDRRPVFMARPGVAALLLESGTRLRTLDFTLSAGEVAQAEADWLEGEGGGPVGMEE